MSDKTRSFSIVAAAFGLLLAASSPALAAPGGPAGDAAAQCGGAEKGKQARFERADKNGDGFLTQAEVGDKRWQRIRVADVNKDNKVSKAELMQAYKDGKLGKQGKGKGKRGDA